jgi:hypothetical protein
MLRAIMRSSCDGARVMPRQGLPGLEARRIKAPSFPRLARQAAAPRNRQC